MSLKRMMNLNRRGKEAFDNGCRCRERFVDVALLPDVRLRKIGRIGPDPRRVRVPCFFFLHHERQWRGFHFNHKQRIETRLLRGARDRGDVALRHARGARQQLQEIKRRALPGQQRARGTFKFAQDRIGRRVRTVEEVPAYLYQRIELPEGFIEPGRSAQHCALAAQYVRARARARRNQTGRDITRSNVLAQRARDLLGQVGGQRAVQNGSG